jgi:hypothetical protein
MTAENAVRGITLNTQMEFRGRVPYTLVMSGLSTVLGIIFVMVAIITGEMLVLLVAVLYLAGFLPLFVYAIRMKKVVLTSTGIEYYVGSKKRFDSNWSEVSKVVKSVLPYLLTLKGEKNNILRMFAEDKFLVVHYQIQMPSKTIREIFEAIKNFAKAYPGIRIEIMSREGTEVVQEGRGEQQSS